MKHNQDWLERVIAFDWTNIMDSDGFIDRDKLELCGDLIQSATVSKNVQGDIKWHIVLSNKAKARELLARINGEIAPPTVEIGPSDLATRLIEARNRRSDNCRLSPTEKDND